MRLGRVGSRRTHRQGSSRPAGPATGRGGRGVDDEVLAHLWPSHHENVHFYGIHTVDVDGEPAKLDADGYRPLRAPTIHSE